MGHIVDYIVVDKREDIYTEAEEFAYYNSDREENDGDYHGNLTIHNNFICDSYDDAYDKIERLTRRSYDDHAVKFYDIDSLKKTKALIRLEERLAIKEEQLKSLVRKTSKKRDKLENDISILKDKIKEINKKRKTKAKVKWLLKVEVHC